MEVHPESGRPETDWERADRNLGELLGELRVALPGVQVLFAFLLVVPFSRGWSQVTAFQEKVYFATLLCTLAASALLIAPSIHHRITFHLQDKHHLVRVANGLTIAGLTLLAVAMTGAIMLITDVLFGTATTIVATAGTALIFAAIWYAIPVRRRLVRTRARAPRRFAAPSD